VSELRDLTAALRAFDKRITSVEECLLVLVRNSEQESEWRHEQRNAAQREILQQEARGRAIKQVEEFQGALWKYLGQLDERLSALALTRVDDVRALSQRVRDLEAKSGGEVSDEVTQA
jgi:hypothetical protein